jgi:DNA-binding IclR family transcriptional regulator
MTKISSQQILIGAREKLLRLDYKGKGARHKGTTPIFTNDMVVMVSMTGKITTWKELQGLTSLPKRTVWNILRKLLHLYLVARPEKGKYSLPAETESKFKEYLSSEDADVEAFLRDLRIELRVEIKQLSFDDMMKPLKMLGLDETKVKDIFVFNYKDRINLVDMITLLFLRRKESLIARVRDMSGLGYDQIFCSMHKMLNLGLVYREGPRKPYHLMQNTRTHLNEFLEGKCSIDELIGELQQQINRFAEKNLGLTTDESVQVEKLVKFPYRKEKARCKGKRIGRLINSMDIRVLVAIFKKSGKKVAFAEICKSLGKTPKTTTVALNKLVDIGLISKTMKGIYSLTDDTKEKLRVYILNKGLQATDLLTSLGIQTRIKTIDIGEELERCSKLSYKELGLCKTDIKVLIMINMDVDRPITIQDTIGLSEHQVLRSLSKLLAKKLVVHEKQKDPYLLHETAREFLLGKANVDTLKANVKSSTEEELNLSSTGRKQFEKLTTFYFGTSNIIVNANSMTILMAGSMLNETFSKSRIQKLLGFGIHQTERSLKELVESKLLQKSETGKYFVSSEIQKATMAYLTDESSSVEELLLTIGAIRLREVDLKILLKIHRHRLTEICKSIGVSRTILFGVLDRFRKLKFVAQKKHQAPYCLTDYAAKYVTKLIESGVDVGVSVQELEIMKKPIERPTKDKPKRIIKTGVRIPKKLRPKKSMETEEEKLLRNFRKLDEELDEKDWKLLSLMVDHKAAGFNHAVIGVADMSTPEINEVVTNPMASRLKLLKARLIEPVSCHSRDCQPTELGRRMLELKNTAVKN